MIMELEDVTMTYLQMLHENLFIASYHKQLSADIKMKSYKI